MPLTPSPSPRDRRFPPQALANEVRTELAASGLPILPPEYDVLTEQASGVSIEGDEEGVWVSWEVHGPLAEASQRAFKVGAWRPGNPDGFDGHPAMKHCAVSRGSMTEVLATILRSLGYGVQADADEYRVGELLVSPRALGAHWRDPAVPPLAGSAGYFPGVRVRLLVGEFAGSVTTIVSGTYRLSASSGPPLWYAVKHLHGDGELDVAPQDVTLADDQT